MSGKGAGVRDKAGKPDREDRLAAALRENLKKRKGLVRKRAATEGSERDDCGSKDRNEET